MLNQEKARGKVYYDVQGILGIKQSFTFKVKFEFCFTVL